MIKKTLIVRNELGLHLRSAAIIAKTSLRFKSKIELIKGDEVANAKSVLNIAGLGATMGTRLIVKAKGKDEVKAVEALEGLFESEFKENGEE